MTREEIISEIKCLLAELDSGADAVSYLTQNDTKWLVENIKALEQEPCEDDVSRKDIYFKLTNGAYSNETIEQFIDRLVKELEALPPVSPQEPKTVIYSGDGYADGYMVYDMAECPNCGYEYEKDDKDWKEPFCPHCGQSLRWESKVEE